MGYRFTARARADLRDIAAYTRDRWGDAQADRYLGALERRCQEMADAPHMRRVYEDAPDYFRSLVGRHGLLCAYGNGDQCSCYGDWEGGTPTWTCFPAGGP